MTATAVPALHLAVHLALQASAVLQGDKTYVPGDIPRLSSDGVALPYVVIGGLTAGEDDHYHEEHGETPTLDLRIWGADLAEALVAYEDVKARLHQVPLLFPGSGWAWEGGTLGLVLDQPEPDRTIGGHLVWARYRSAARRIA